MQGAERNISSKQAARSVGRFGFQSRQARWHQGAVSAGAAAGDDPPRVARTATVSAMGCGPGATSAMTYAGVLPSCGPGQRPAEEAGMLVSSRLCGDGAVGPCAATHNAGAEAYSDRQLWRHLAWHKGILLAVAYRMQQDWRLTLGASSPSRAQRTR